LKSLHQNNRLIKQQSAFVKITINMLFQTIAVLALATSVVAHPHRGGHRKHFKPSGSGKVVAPTGGKYNMGNGTAGYGPTGTGFATGSSGFGTGSVTVPTDTAVDPASNCTAGSEPTTTIYETDFVTMTVTAEDTITVATSSASLSVVPSYPLTNATATSYPTSNATATSVDDTETSPVVTPSVMTSSDESTVDGPSATTAETSSADYYAPAVTSSSSDVTSAASTPSAPSVTTASPAETTEAPIESSEASYASSTEMAPGGFYEASSSAGPVASSVSSSGSYKSGKRGLAYNSAKLTQAFAGGSISWAYNWGDNAGGTLGAGIEFVPMLWGQKMFSGWDAAAKSAIASGAKHLLSFNEPDLSAQANMDSATAAAAHIKYMNPYASQAEIGSPAVTNGGPSGGTDGMGLGWLQNFFDKCAGKCKVDFVTFHWYDSGNNVAYFKNYVEDVIKLAKKNGVNKVWATEFAAAGSDTEVAKFLGEVLPWMDSNDAVERYAYFMCEEGKLVSGSAMSDPVGKAYAG
jgi:Glycosyl hydrolase catalytic core